MTATLRSRVLPLVLLLAGLALTVWLIGQAGPAAILRVLRNTARWLPIIVGLEMAMAVCDAVAVRTLLGATGAQVPPRGWVRSTGLAYGACILLPAGRLTGEAVRAAVLATSVGLARATLACAHLQASALAGNAVISLVGLAVLATLTPRPSVLLLALAANGLACAVLASAVFLLARHPGTGAWLRKRLAHLLPPLSDTASGDSVAGPRRQAVLWCVVARLLQTLQYGVVVAAVGGAFGVTQAFAGQGIHLVGAAVGDAIPGQMGATEGSYRAFAHVLGFAADPARAIAIALLMRAVQLSVAACGLLTGFAVGRLTAPTEAA